MVYRGIAGLGLVAELLLGILAAVLSRSHIRLRLVALRKRRPRPPDRRRPSGRRRSLGRDHLADTGHRRWIQLGLVSGLISLALAGGTLLALMALGPGGRDVAATISLSSPSFIWLVAGRRRIAALIPPPDQEGQGPPLWSIYIGASEILDAWPGGDHRLDPSHV